MICKNCFVDKSIDDFYANGHGGVRIKCKVCTTARDKQWREDNRERRLELKRDNNRTRRAAKFDVPIDMPRVYRDAIVAFYGGVCLKCGIDQDLQLDHVIPLSKGGGHTLDNLQVLCGRDNVAKGNRNSDDFRYGTIVTLKDIDDYISGIARSGTLDV